MPQTRKPTRGAASAEKLYRCPESHLLRNSNPSLISQNIIEFDKLVDETLKHIIGQPLTWEERTLAHLPLSMGGLGIPIAAWIAPAAFVSSIGSSWSLQKVSTPRSGFDYFRNYLASLGVSVPVLTSKNNLVNPPNSLFSNKLLAAQ